MKKKHKDVTEKFKTSTKEANKAQIRADKYFNGNKSAWYRWANEQAPLPRESK